MKNSSIMLSSDNIEIEIESTISTKNTDQTVSTSENGKLIRENCKIVPYKIDCGRNTFFDVLMALKFKFLFILNFTLGKTYN